MTKEINQQKLIEACEAKVPYLTKDEAKRAKHGLSKARGRKVSVYRCQHCRCFHFTSLIEQE